MEKKNYFNSIPWREARLQLGHCRFMAKEEFADGTKALQGKKSLSLVVEHKVFTKV